MSAAYTYNLYIYISLFIVMHREIGCVINWLRQGQPRKTVFNICMYVYRKSLDVLVVVSVKHFSSL